MTHDQNAFATSDYVSILTRGTRQEIDSCFQTRHTYGDMTENPILFNRCASTE